jgi:hypothetical protein
MENKNFFFYQKNPIKLEKSIKYNYRYNYCPPFIKGTNNSFQYPNYNCFYLLNDDPYIRKLPDSLSKNNIGLPKRSQIIYNNSTDKNWGPQTVNRKFWEQQNKIYNSNDQLLSDKIDKIKYEETKRKTNRLKNANPNSLRNGYYIWDSKNNNWYYENKNKKYKKSMFGNIGVNTNIYKGDTYKIHIDNIETDPIWYYKNNIRYGGDKLF